MDQVADLLLDLPQVRLEDAKENLFVKDMVRHPIIKDYYRGNEEYKRCPESILQPCEQNQNTNTLHKVPVRYQRDAQLIANREHSFVFDVFIDSIESAKSFLPKEFRFTCRADYDYYYEAFINDLIVDAGVWGPVEVEDGAIVTVFTGNSFDLATVHKNDGKVFARMIAPSSGEVEINHLTMSCIRSIDLNPDVLFRLSARCSGGQIDGYYRIWYEITLNDSNATIVRFARTRYAGGFCLIVEDANDSAYYSFSTIQFMGLDGLQKVIKQQYGISYCPSQDALTLLTAYFKNAYPRQLFMLELSRIIDFYGLDADYATVLNAVCKQLNIPAAEAEFFLSGFMKRGYFAE